jgi:hypothetical protein
MIANFPHPVNGIQQMPPPIKHLLHFLASQEISVLVRLGFCKLAKQNLKQDIRETETINETTNKRKITIKKTRDEGKKERK